MGTEQSTRQTRVKAVQSVLKKRNVKGTELHGKERDVALREFVSGKGWHRGLEVDRLSDKEAGIIAERLVRRVGAKVSLSDTKAEALRRVLVQAFRRRLIRDPANVEQQTLEQWRHTLLQAAGNHLDQRGIEALQEALGKGYRPLPGEQ